MLLSGSDTPAEISEHFTNTMGNIRSYSKFPRLKRKGWYWKDKWA